VSRTSHIERKTSESHVVVDIDLDGTGAHDISTGVGFYDHMLTAFARHSLIDLTVKTVGDLHIDAHHTVEDTAICIGEALRSALGDKSGIRRYGSATVLSSTCRAGPISCTPVSRNVRSPSSSAARTAVR
jgi:imidazoleglycerol-phosphate dehydratase